MIFYAGVVHKVAVGIELFGFVDWAKNDDIFAVRSFVVVQDIGGVVIFEL